MNYSLTLASADLNTAQPYNWLNSDEELSQLQTLLLLSIPPLCHGSSTKFTLSPGGACQKLFFEITTSSTRAGNAGESGRETK